MGTLARNDTTRHGNCAKPAIQKLDGYLTLLWRRSLSYRNKSIHLQSKSMNWFLYDTDLCHKELIMFLCLSVKSLIVNPLLG